MGEGEGPLQNAARYCPTIAVSERLPLNQCKKQPLCFLHLNGKLYYVALACLLAHTHVEVHLLPDAKITLLLHGHCNKALNPTESLVDL